ncbi:hypothetical protein Arub01_42660 [Actinomadura rubrobrunea]|uniref:Uncharacterized protein n=1 Tax=Actinomadura rubrobrunea TaxID=115335 RepID=A0A9W6PYA6_9ACTN|nr:hypothetical protein [Actinomadura rubrobrunea]GLW66022.1 hypothetical protein Arub01_42660 [Actinomadura rubrobrunea]
MTLDAVSAVMRRYRSTGECLNGAYFWCADLIIIDRPGIPAIVEVVRHLIASGELEGACSLLRGDDLASE